MITLLKGDSDTIAVRDICTETTNGKILLPKDWRGRITAVTKADGEPTLYVQGVNPRTKEVETFFCLDPGDFEPDLPNKNEVRVCAKYYDGRGDIYGCYA